MLINPAPPLQAYLQQAFATGVLSTSLAGCDAIYNQYINIMIPGGIIGGRVGVLDYAPHTVIDDFVKYGLVKVNYVDDAHVSSLTPDSLEELLKNAIINNKAVISFLDEFYIPHTFSYRREHFRHSAFVSEFKAGYFSCHTYLESGRYGATYLTAEELVLSIMSPFDRVKGRYNFGNLIKILECPDVNTSSGLEPRKIGQQIEDFLNSRETVFPAVLRRTGAYGLEVYSLIGHFIRSMAEENTKLDIRFSRLLYERALLMRCRIKALQVAGYLSNNKQLEERWDRGVVDTARQLHWQASFDWKCLNHADRGRFDWWQRTWEKYVYGETVLLTELAERLAPI